MPGAGPEHRPGPRRRTARARALETVIAAVEPLPAVEPGPDAVDGITFEPAGERDCAQAAVRRRAQVERFMPQLRVASP